MSQRPWIVERMSMKFVGEMRIRLGTTGEGSAELVDKLDHHAAQRIADLVREIIGIGPQKEHPWAAKGKLSRK